MRLHRFLGMWAILALAVGITVVVDGRLREGDGADQVVEGPGTTASSGVGETTASSAGVTVVPGPGQVRVTGTLTGVHLEGAVLTPRELPAPLTVVSDRGFGNGGELTGIVVGGQPSTAVWDGGRPFVLASGGALVLDPVTVDLTADGLRLLLGGANHRLSPGTYRLDTPVAVGTAGIATPQDAVTFDATADALFQARGDAGIVLGPDVPRAFAGPGRVRLDGTLELTDAAGTRPAPSFEGGPAAFELTFTPLPTGEWRVDGLVDESQG